MSEEMRTYGSTIAYYGRGQSVHLREGGAGDVSTFKKRQKEMARAQKRSDKAAKRLERKEGNTSSGPEVITLEEAAILRS